MLDVWYKEDTKYEKVINRYSINTLHCAQSSKEFSDFLSQTMRINIALSCLADVRPRNPQSVCACRPDYEKWVSVPRAWSLPSPIGLLAAELLNIRSISASPAK